jgi:hypothetical protein
MISTAGLNSLQFDRVFDLTRTTGRWRFNAQGNLVQVSSGNPAFDFDPVSGQPLGLLVEAQRTQLLLRTEMRIGDSPDGSLATGATGENLDANYLGQFRGVRVASGGSGAARLITRAFTGTDGVTVAWTALFASGTSGRARVQIDRSPNSSVAVGVIGALAVISSAAGTMTILRQVQLLSGEYLVQGTWTPNSTGASVIGIGPDSATVGTDIIAIAAQVSVGTVPAPWIITTGTSLTHNADQVSAIKRKIGYRDGGTFVVRYRRQFAQSTGTPHLFTLSDGTDDNVLRAVYNTTTGRLRFSVIDDGVEAAADTTAPFVGSGFVAFSFDKDGYRYSINGSAPVSVETPIPSGLFDRVAVGAGYNLADLLDGHISLLAHTPRMIEDLQSLSTPGNTELNFAEDEYLIGGMNLEGATQLEVPFRSVLDFVRVSNGWRFNADGELEQVGVNQPRFTFDPVTGEPRGLLVEAQRTQLITNTEVRDGAGWDAVSATLTNLSENYLGQFRGVRVASAGGSSHTIRNTNNMALTSAAVYSWTAVFLPGTSGRIRVTLQNLTGSTTSVVAGVIGSATALTSSAGTLAILRQAELATGEHIIQGTLTANATANYRIQVGPDSATVGEDIIAIAAQVEAGSTPSILIISEGAATTRTRDELTIPLTFPGYNANEGTWVVEWEKDFSEAGVTRAVLHVGADVNNRITLQSLFGGGGTRITSVISGSATSSTASSDPFIGRHRAAFTVLNGVCHASVDGQTSVSIDATGLDVSSFVTASVGHTLTFSDHINGTIPRINYYPRALTASQLQVMSAL